MTLRLLTAATLVLLVTACAHGHQLETDLLLLRVDDQGRVTIHDKRTGVTWQPATPVSEGPSWSWIAMGRPLAVKAFGPEKIPEVTAVEASAEEITVSLKWKIPLVCRWSLSAVDTVQARLESQEKTASVPSNGGWMVLYPPPFYATTAADYAVVCEDEGVLYRTDEIDPQADPHRYASGSVGRSRSMPWSGLLDPDLSSGMMTLVDTPFYAIEKMIFCDTPDGRRSLPAVQWEKGKHPEFEPRTVRFHLFANGGYVAMAKRFRSELIAEGKFRTLAEKARDVPNVRKLKGAMDMWIFPPKRKPLTAEDVERIHGLGFDRLLLQVCVGNQPLPNAAFTSSAVEKAHEYGYLIGQYHLYSWVYEWQYKQDPTAKAACLLGPNGYQISESLWGANLKCCPAPLIDKLKAVAARERAYGCDSVFTDCTTAGGSVQDCFDENHPLSRATATVALGRSLHAITDEGMIAGSERGFWWAAADCDYFEGIETPIRYFNMFANESPTQHHAGPFQVERPEDYDRYMLGFTYGPQNRVPLFQLVFHDCVVCTRRWNDHYGRDMDLWRLSDLMNMVHGTPPIVKFLGDDTPHVMKEDFATVQELYMRTFRDVCGWHEQIGFDEMTDHRFLSKDRLVQESRFSSGHEVVGNFGSAAWYDPRGFRVPASSFHRFSVNIGEGETNQPAPDAAFAPATVEKAYEYGHLIGQYHLPTSK